MKEMCGHRGPNVGSGGRSPEANGGKGGRSPGGGRRQALLVPVLILLIWAGAAFNTGSTYSWFLYGSDTHLSTDGGDVSFLPKDNADGAYGSFIPNTEEDRDDSYIYPGRQLIKSDEIGGLKVLRLKNLSTIPTNARVRITGTVETGGGGAAVTTRAAICKPRTGAGSGAVEGGFWMGLDYRPSPEGAAVFIPLLNLDFGGTAESYSWILSGQPVKAGTFEWELVPAGQAADNAVVPIPSPEGDFYDTLVSIQVVSSLETQEKERIFTDIYSGRKLLVKVEYLARQHDVMEWNVFYENSVTL